MFCELKRTEYFRNVQKWYNTVTLIKMVKLSFYYLSRIFRRREKRGSAFLFEASTRRLKFRMDFVVGLQGLYR